MKSKRKYIAFLLSIILFLGLFDGKIIVTKAVSQFTTSTITIDGNEYACYNNDDPNMPSSFQYFWAVSGRVYHADSAKMLMLMLNKRFGLVVSENWFTSFLSTVNIELMGASAKVLSMFTGSVVRVTTHGNMCGIALNDLNGLPLADAQTNSENVQVVIPDQVVDTNKEILDDYLETNPLTPDIITIPTRNKQQFLSGINTTGAYYAATVDTINSPPVNTLFGCGVWSSGFDFIGGTRLTQYYYAYNNNNNSNILYAASTEYAFNSICTDFNLTQDDNAISYEDLTTSTSQAQLYIYVKDTSTLENQPITLHFMSGSESTTTQPILVFLGNNKVVPYSTSESDITIYKSATVVSNITNNVYNQQVYTSNDWRNYNISNDNSITTNNNTVNNSTTNNNSIYDNSSTEVNNNIKENNYTYNTNQIDNSVTTIINNYYGDDSGGGGDNDDDDDDTIWDALLKAIADFFKKIGELLAAVLTGIIDVFTQMIEAAATITTGFTGLTNLFSSFFDWLPSEILAPIILGLTAMIFICLLKAFKG